MKKFEAAKIVEMNELALEPVYFQSGSPSSVPTTPLTPATAEWTITTEWCNHNSGSHSEIKVKAHNNGKSSGDNLKMDFRIGDFKLYTLTPGDSCLVLSNQTEDGFTITRTGRHFNPGENIEFVMQLTSTKQDGSIGAVGKTGDYIPCNVFCTGFEQIN